jgi:hypothetical protein
MGAETWSATGRQLRLPAARVSVSRSPGKRRVLSTAERQASREPLTLAHSLALPAVPRTKSDRTMSGCCRFSRATKRRIPTNTRPGGIRKRLER